jgi:hypothetical protein
MRILTEDDTSKKSPMIGNKVNIIGHGAELSTTDFIVEDVIWCEFPYARLSLRGDGIIVHNIPLSDLEKI